MKSRRGILTSAICLLLAASLVLSACTFSLSDDNLTEEQAREKLAALASIVRVTHSDPQPDNSWVGTEGTINELPDIATKYPLSVRGSGRIDVEIFSSTEKATKDGSGWLDIQAKKFNNASRSVSIRPIASGSAVGYITSGTYLPGAYTPSNVLWAEMLRARGVSIEVVTDSLTTNTAGILMKPETHKAFTEKYGAVTIEKVVEAIMAGDLIVAHTDPNVSSTGLNIMTQQLRAFDPENPFSEMSRERMRTFSAMIPPVSPTTAEMVKVASSGLADAIISEYQSWKSDPALKDWVFTPVGVRHDSPLYAISSEVTPEQAAVLREFAEFCSSPAAQAEATSLGFNPTDGYVGVPNKFSGTELFKALEFWKQNKDGGRVVISVFVADRSGSMEGEPLAQLKASLLNGSHYINEEYYVGLVSYASDVTIDVPIDRFNAAQHSLFYGAVRSLQARGNTATNDALVVAMDMLVKKQEELGVNDAKLRVFLLSDGRQNEGFSLNQVRGVISGLNIPIYTIGYNAEVDTLQELSSMNEAYFTAAETGDVIMKIKELFTAQL